MRKINKTPREVIWKDPLKVRVLLLIFLLLIPLIIISAGVVLPFNVYLGIISIIASIVYFIFLLLRVRKSRIIIYLTGISMGSLEFLSTGITKFKEECIFTKWSDIENLKIINHFVRSTYIGYPLPFLILKRKNGKILKLGLKDPTEFLKALDKIGKKNLVLKDPRYNK